MPLARLNVVSTIFRVVSWRFDRYLRNEIAPPRIMHKQTRAPVSRLRCPLPVLIYIPYEAVVLPQLSGKSRSLVQNIRCLLFSFYYPDFLRRSARTLHNIGIPAFFGIISRDLVSGAESINRRPHFGQRIGFRSSVSSYCSTSFLLRRKSKHPFPPEPIRLPGSGPAICAQLFLHNVREPMRHRSGKKPRVEVRHL